MKTEGLTTATIQSSGAMPAEETVGAKHSASIASGAMKLAASQVVRRGCRVGFLLVAARILGPHNFGLYALMISVIELLGMISGAGFMELLTREVARSPESGGGLWFQLTGLRFLYLAVLISITLAVLLGAGYARPAALLGALFALTLFPRAVIESTQGVLRALHRFGSFLFLEVIQGSVLFGFGIAFLYAGKGLPGVVWAELIAAGCGAAGALWVIPRSSNTDARIPMTWRETIRRTFVFNLWPILVNLYDRFDVILLSRLVSQAVAGIYAVPYRAFGALQIFPYGIMGSSLPGFSAKEWDQTQRERFHRLLGWLFALSAFLVLFTMLFAGSAVQVLLGPAYRDSALVMKILIWAVVPAFLNNGMNMLLLARNREHVFLRTAGVCLAANLAANLVLIPRYSFIAAASVTIFTELLLLGQNALLTRPLLGSWPWPRYWIRTSVAFGAIFGAALLAHGRASLPGLAVSLAAVSAFGFLLLYMDVLPTRGIRAIFERAI